MTRTILHLGLGSFHRAHQAAYLQLLHELGAQDWEIAAGNIRPGDEPTIDALVRQGGAYALETVAPDGQHLVQMIRSIRRVVPYTPDLREMIAIGADPTTRIISFTVTEVGYHLDAQDRLVVPRGEIAAAREGRPGGTIYGALTAILRARMVASASGVTLLSCDNLRHNGRRVRAGLLQFVDAIGDGTLRDWILANTTSPNTMVDRITPRPTPAIRERLRAMLGDSDAVPVMAESFAQWVIEDDFRNGRPAWEKVGVTFVESVLPFEEAKIRILNASHSILAWGGALAGLTFIHESVAQTALRRLAFDYVTDEVVPCLRPSPVDLERYRDVVLARFAVDAIADTNQRVAADSFGKIPAFIAPTLHDRLARREPVARLGAVAALFLRFLEAWHRGALPFAHADQAMEARAAREICEAADPVAALCALGGLWGAAAGDARFVDAVRRAR